MNSSVITRVIFLSIILLILQIFIPVININGFEITPDILIIFLTYIGYYYGSLETIIMGFLFGLIQDFVTQYELIGIMAFVKSLIGYGLGTMALYRSIWHRNLRIIFIFCLYFLHFYIYYYIKLNSITVSNLYFLEIIFFHTILSFAILLIVDKSIMKNGVSKKRHP